MKKIRIGILGPDGRMGKDLLNQIKNFKQLELSSLCEKKGHKLIGQKISEVIVEDNITNFLSKSDVIIDFTSPAATIKLLEIMNRLKTETPLVSGTTGYSTSEEKKFQLLVKGKRVLRSFNMSIGINILKNLVKLVSRNAGSQADIEIVEIHHNQKKDIPSGTSLALAHSINEGDNKFKNFAFREKNNDRIREKYEIGFASIRGGDVIGEHTVYFFLDGERLELKHTASSRNIFSNGALLAAKWIHGKKPGLYSIADMIKR